MENKVIIYSGDYCTHCKVVKQFMEKNNIKYEERDISNEEYKEQITSRGILSIPVLVVNDKYHSVNSSNFIGVLKDVL